MHRMLLAAAALSVASPASAAVFAIDGGFGAGSATRSTATGLDVVDLPLTIGNYSDIDAELSPGGLFADWRRATRAEIVAFWADGGVNIVFGTEPAPESALPAYVASVSALMDLVGLTEASGSIDLSEGFLAEGAPDPDEATIAYLRRRFDRDLGAFTLASAVTDVTRQRELTFGGDNIGHWLVRNIAVPAPAGLGLLGLGIAALLRRGRRLR